MQITKCDICHKTIKNKEGGIHLRLEGDFFKFFEICQKCGLPIMKFLKSKKLLKKKK